MHDSNEEWALTTMRSAMDECDHTPYKMFGFAILGGLAMAFTNPIIAAAIGLGGIGWCFKKEWESCDRAEFAVKHGGSAVAAKGKMLKAYVADVGREACTQQLLCAAKMGYPINQDGWNLLEDHFGEEKLNELLDDESEPDHGGHPFFFPEIKPIKGSDAMKSAEPAAAVTQDTDPLLKRLKIECPELLLLVKAPPIRIVGHQRTGKSSLARKLALLRRILLPGHTIAWCTPHLERDNRLPLELNPMGYTQSGAKDISAIEGRWVGIQRDIDAGRHPNQTIVWDEFGCYDLFQNPDLLGPSLRSLLRESSKHEYYPILIAHGDQAAFYPGVKNILTTLKQGTVKIETIGEPADDFGTMRPTGKFRIYDRDGENFKELQIPEWLTEDYLLGLLKGIPENLPQSIAPAISENLFTAIAPPAVSKNLIQPIAPPAIFNNLSQPTQVSISPKDKLEETYKLDIAEPTQIKEVEPTPIDYSELHEFLHPLIQYSIKHGWVSARTIKQNVRTYALNNADEIREFFIRAAESVGNVRGVDNTLQYAALPGEMREKC